MGTNEHEYVMTDGVLQIQFVRECLYSLMHFF